MGSWGVGGPRVERGFGGVVGGTGGLRTLGILGVQGQQRVGQRGCGHGGTVEIWRREGFGDMRDPRWQPDRSHGPCPTLPKHTGSGAHTRT